jgi:uncharacterized protein YjbJ (UPF0337 family)
MRPENALLAALVAALVLQVPLTMAQTPAVTTTEAPASAPDTLRKKAWDKVSGNWKRFKGSVRQRWGKLTKNEVAQARGRREALNGFIQARYGIDREAADRQIDEWLKTVK